MGAAESGAIRLECATLVSNHHKIKRNRETKVKRMEKKKNKINNRISGKKILL